VDEETCSTTCSTTCLFPTSSSPGSTRTIMSTVRRCHFRVSGSLDSLARQLAALPCSSDLLRAPEHKRRLRFARTQHSHRRQLSCTPYDTRSFEQGSQRKINNTTPTLGYSLDTLVNRQRLERHVLITCRP
jgi:hypothetical protein